MRIAIASDDGVNVAMHTGRCRGFVVYEVDNGVASRKEYRENRFTAHALGQCGNHDAREPSSSHPSHAPLAEALADCSALVTRGLGPRLVADLAARGVQSYLSAAETADEAAAQYARGMLLPASAAGSCCHH
jgi:nitrogen fixation protein NifB